MATATDDVAQRDPLDAYNGLVEESIQKLVHNPHRPLREHDPQRDPAATRDATPPPPRATRERREETVILINSRPRQEDHCRDIVSNRYFVIVVAFVLGVLIILQIQDYFENKIYAQ